MAQPLSLAHLRRQAERHHTAWVQVAIALGTVGYGVSFGLQVAGKPAPFPAAFSDLGALAALLTALVLVLRGRTTVAVGLAIAAVWTEIHVSIVISGLQSGALTVLPLFVAATGLLMGSRVAFGVALVTCLSVPGVALLGAAVHDQPLSWDDISLLVLLAIVLVGMALLVALFLRSFAEVLQDALDKEQRYADLFRDAPVGIVAIGGDGRVEAVNPEAERILALPSADAVDLTIEELLGSRLLGAPTDELVRLASGAARPVPHAVRRADGTVVPVEITVRRTAPASGASRTQVVLRDVSERIRFEEEQRSLQTQLQHAQKMEAVGRLAGGVAHDFNNLLMAVGASAELLEMAEGAETRELAGRILLARDRGIRLTRQLLTFARKDVAQPRPVVPSEVLEESLALIRGLVGERVRVAAELRPSRWIVADPGQLEQVVLNLAANARDAMPDGGVLTVETGDADLPGHPPAVWLRVRDTGVGMSPGTRARLFEPFFTTKPRGKGTGLGLATVHGIVAQNGGWIEVDSAPGSGSTFTVYWPAGPEGPVEPAAEGRPAVPPRVGAATVLLVEDDEQSRALVRLLLERSGHTVVEAPDGESALERAAGVPVDLLLSDVVMPGISGVELAHRLRAARPDLAVLLMSGYVEDPLVREGSLSSHDLLLKPFPADELRARVAAALAARPQGGVPPVEAPDPKDP